MKKEHKKFTADCYNHPECMKSLESNRPNDGTVPEWVKDFESLWEASLDREGDKNVFFVKKMVHRIVIFGAEGKAR